MMACLYIKNKEKSIYVYYKKYTKNMYMCI